jgi:hypothetical protein
MSRGPPGELRTSCVAGRVAKRRGRCVTSPPCSSSWDSRAPRSGPSSPMVGRMLAGVVGLQVPTEAVELQAAQEAVRRAALEAVRRAALEEALRAVCASLRRTPPRLAPTVAATSCARQVFIAAGLTARLTTPLSSAGRHARGAPTTGAQRGAFRTPATSSALRLRPGAKAGA